MCAFFACSAECSDSSIIAQLSGNIRRYIFPYIFSYASMGYKIYALLISLNWKLFCRVVGR